MGFGSTVFTDTQVFEAGHKPNVNALANLTNRNGQFSCIAHCQDVIPVALAYLQGQL